MNTKTLTLALTNWDGDELLRQPLDRFTVSTEPGEEFDGNPATVQERAEELRQEVIRLIESAGGRPTSTPVGLKLQLGQALISAIQDGDEELTLTLKITTEGPDEEQSNC